MSSRTPGSPATTAPRPPSCTDALAAWAAGHTAYAEALAALQRSRLLVPVVAVLGEVEVDADGLAREKTSDMAAVLLRGADGRLALLAFTGTPAADGLGPRGAGRCRWPRPWRRARPCRTGRRRWSSTSPARCASSSRATTWSGLAEGWTLARVGDRTAWIRPDGESSATIRR